MSVANYPAVSLLADFCVCLQAKMYLKMHCVQSVVHWSALIFWCTVLCSRTRRRQKNMPFIGGVAGLLGGVFMAGRRGDMAFLIVIYFGGFRPTAPVCVHVKYAIESATSPSHQRAKAHQSTTRP